MNFFLLPYSTGNCEVLNDPYGAANGSRDNIRKATGLVYDPLMAEHRNPWDPGMNLETKKSQFFFCVQWGLEYQTCFKLQRSKAVGLVNGSDSEPPWSTYSHK